MVNLFSFNLYIIFCFLVFYHYLCFMIYFTSDSHIGHKNIIQYCQRPFETSLDMNLHIVQSWNSVVKPEDTVYHLGDFIFSLTRKWSNRLLEKLNGTIIVIKGNHDREKYLNYYLSNGLIESWHYNLDLSYDYNGNTYHFSLSHYPHYPLKGSNLICLHGHVHGLYEHREPHKKHPRVLDVGVDSIGYVPISIENIIKKMNLQNNI